MIHELSIPTLFCVGMFPNLVIFDAWDKLWSHKSTPSIIIVICSTLHFSQPSMPLSRLGLTILIPVLACLPCSTPMSASPCNVLLFLSWLAPIPTQSSPLCSLTYSGSHSTTRFQKSPWPGHGFSNHLQPLQSSSFTAFLQFWPF